MGRGVLILAGLAVATFVSEDAACVAAGLLVQQGRIGAVPAIVACAVGIFLGDLALWTLGRFGRCFVSAWPVLARRVPAARLEQARAWLEARPAVAILGSRLVPGTRLPTYVAAGLVRLPGRTFSLWAGVAVSLWAPALVLISATATEAATRAPSTALLPAWAAPAVVAALLLLRPRIARRSAGVRSASRARLAPWRRRAAAWIERRRRWEFLPPWCFYMPVVVWVGILALRYRGLTTIAAANPGIPDGGLVGESKSEILARLPAEWTIPSMRVNAGAARTRWRAARQAIDHSNWSFPLVLKPDAGQRGAGVRLAHSHRDVARYLRRVTAPVLVQPYHPGPYEAGIFYCRHPGDARGRILAITDKRFPFVVGDGRSTLADLVHAHPRFRVQASLLLRRHAAGAARIVPAGERVTLSYVGNHAQGAVFLDGAHLWTPALEAHIDEIARGYPGFFIGRFDVRYRDAETFKAGRDLAIVELNGVTGEPTNIYDPRGSLLGAYRGLFRQWSLVFAIGHANRRRGVQPGSVRRLIGLIGAHLTSRPAWHALE